MSQHNNCSVNRTTNKGVAVSQDYDNRLHGNFNYNSHDNSKNTCNKMHGKYKIVASEDTGHAQH